MAYNMSEADNAKIIQYQQAYQAAKAAGDQAGMARAHAGAEAVRNSYGFSGGDDGSQQLSIAPQTKGLLQNNPYSTYLNGVKQQQQQAQQRYGQMMNYSRDSYANMLKSAIAANNAAATQQIARLNTQKAEANKTYEDNARQAYVAYMQGRQTLPQMLAASGLTGGATETANLGLVTNYNSNLGNINNERAKAVRAIDDNIQSAIYQAERDNAQTAYENAGSALNSYLGIMNNSIDSDYNYLNTYGNAFGRYVDQENYQSDVQREAENLAYQRQQALADQNYERSLQRLQLGMANTQDLAELGLTENDYNTYLMENFGRDISGNYVIPVSGGSSGGGGSSSGGSGGRRSSGGRSYSGGGSGGSSSSGNAAGDLVFGSDAWGRSIYEAAREAGVSGKNYLTNMYNNGQIKSQKALTDAQVAYEEWEKKNASSNTGSSPVRIAEQVARLTTSGGGYEGYRGAVANLVDKGYINDKTGIYLLDKYKQSKK